MNESSLNRLMRLAQKTGDVLIVTDPDGREPLVLMSVDRYEEMRLGPDACCDDEDWAGEEETPEDLDVGTDEGEDFGEFLMRKEGEERIPSIDLSEEGDDEAEFADRIGPLPEDPKIAPIRESFPSEFLQEEQKKQEQVQLKSEGEERFYLEPIE